MKKTQLSEHRTRKIFSEAERTSEAVNDSLDFTTLYGFVNIVPFFTHSHLATFKYDMKYILSSGLRIVVVDRSSIKRAEMPGSPGRGTGATCTPRGCDAVDQEQ